MNAIRTFLLTFALARVSAEVEPAQWNKPSKVFDTEGRPLVPVPIVFETGGRPLVGIQKVFDTGGRPLVPDPIVFDTGTHRTVGVEAVFDIGGNPIINTDADPTMAPTESPTTLAPTKSPVARQYEVIFAESFENGYGNFIDGDGGSSKVSLNGDADYVHSGSQSVQIKDDSEVSTLYTGDINVSSFTEVMVSFWYKSKKVDAGEGFYFETKTAGGDWVKLEKFVLGAAWTVDGNDGGVFHEGLVEFSVADTDFLAIKFSGFALASLDYIYIDDVTVSGK
jgi:hypothetical protein